MNEINFTEFANSYEQFLKTLGDFYIKLGNLEKENPSFRSFYVNALTDPNTAKQLISGLPQEVSKEFSEILVELIFISNTKNLDTLSPEDKIAVGNRFVNISNKFQTLYTKLIEIKNINK